MMNAFVFFARKSSPDVKSKSGALPTINMSCTVQPKDVTQDRTSGSIRELR